MQSPSSLDEVSFLCRGNLCHLAWRDVSNCSLQRAAFSCYIKLLLNMSLTPWASVTKSLKTNTHVNIFL